MQAVAIIAIVLAAALIHELGHVIVARAYGWRVVRPASHPAGGLGIAFDTRGRMDALWKVALGGLGASALATLFFIALIEDWVSLATVGAVTNAAVLFVNLLPIPGSDGSQIWRGLRR